MNYSEFFEVATRDETAPSGYEPFPYQKRLGEGEFPTLLDIPTGLGKTAAVTLAWMYKRLVRPEDTPRRLVYCLPMRTLVSQTANEAEAWIDNVGTHFEESGDIPSVNILMGGEQDLEWVDEPERPAIIIGTQDMLISRALMRGYGMNRYAWPIHHGLLQNDALWVFDETQLMGVTVETSAQLQAFREQFGTAGDTQSIWMSATLSGDQLETVDHPKPDDGWSTVELDDSDFDKSIVHQRITATKPIQRSDIEVPRKSGEQDDYAEKLAGEVSEYHVDGTLTLVISNRVDRAQKIYRALLDVDGRDDSNTSLIHSRFRRVDRDRNEALLEKDGDRVIVATQVVEAGLDISAATMFTELAPWPSLVQRFGRCNRRGEQPNANVFWIDIEYSTSGRAENDGYKPYELDDILDARDLIAELDDVGPRTLDGVEFEPDAEIRPVLRRKDLLELFDTTADLSGHDIDVSRYIRDTDDTDVQFFWRLWDDDDEQPPKDMAAPQRDEICRVSIINAKDFVGKNSLTAWAWDGLDDCWKEVDDGDIRPGQTVLLDARDGGYDPGLGWTGDKRRKNSGEPLTTFPPDGEQKNESVDDDGSTDVHRWIALRDHLEHVADSARELADALDVDERTRRWLVEAAQWHDVGKSLPVFQNMLLEPLEEHDIEPPEGEGPWAKSNHRKGSPSRKHFRHELASALAYLQSHDNDLERDIVAYLIAAHHGKVRMSIRSFPGEDKPTGDVSRDDLFARGVWHGDLLEPVDIPGYGTTQPLTLDLRLMELGEGSWLEKTLSIRDELGPFHLARLEALLRIADQRASAREKANADDE